MFFVSKDTEVRGTNGETGTTGNTINTGETGRTVIRWTGNGKVTNGD